MFGGLGLPVVSGTGPADLEKDASAARWKFSESEEIMGGNHGKLSYFPGFNKQNDLVFGEILHYPSLCMQYACFVAK